MNYNSNTKSILNVNNVLNGVILCNCLKYLQLKELYLIITRVNKYWANHVYNNITLGYRGLLINSKHGKLLSQYIKNNNIDNNNNDNNKALNLLNRIKYTSLIYLTELQHNDQQLFLYIIKHAKNMQTFRICIARENAVNYLANTDESLNNVRLDKLEILHIIDCSPSSDGIVYNHLLTQLMKYIRLDKLKQIHLRPNIPIHAKPLQIFETNQFINLTNLQLMLRVSSVSNDSLNYLSNLTQLIQLSLLFICSFEDHTAPIHWNWLIKLINLEKITIRGSESIFSFPDQATCVKVLTNLPKLSELTLLTNPSLLMGPNELLQLFFQLKTLKSLSIYGIDCNEYDLNVITFPTISTLINVTITFGDASSIIPILKSNPQINCIRFCHSKPHSKVMIDILQVAPSLLQYSFASGVIDPIITCSETYPHPLINNVVSEYKSFINCDARQQLISRIKQHLQPGYECSNTTCCKPIKQL